MRVRKGKKIVEAIGIIITLITILIALNADDIQKIIYEDNIEIPFHNIFYEDREVSLSNSGDKIAIYDGIAILIRDIKTSKEVLVLSLESRGVVKDFKWSEDDKHIVYLKDEFNDDFSLWAIDIEEGTNTKISLESEYSFLSHISSVSSENFIYPVYRRGSKDTNYYSVNLNYLTREVVNNQKEYDNILFNSSSEKILGVKVNNFLIEYNNPNSNETLGSISLKNSASAGYYEIIGGLAYFTMYDNDMTNLYCYDGDKVEILKRDIDKNLKVEKTILINGNFAGIYGVKDNYKWLIEDKYRENFKFVEEEDTSYKLINSSLNGERLLVRPTKDYDPGDYHLIDINSGESKEIVNIKNSISKEKLYHTETINYINPNGEYSKESRFKLTLGNTDRFTKELFVILDSDISNLSLNNKYDPLVQAMADRGINIARISYDYSPIEVDKFSIEKESKEISRDIETILAYLKNQKNIDIENVHIISKGKSALFATNILEEDNLYLRGLVLLEPIFDIKNSPITSLAEKSLIDSISDYPDIKSYTEKYNINGRNLIVYLNTEVSDSDITNEFYKNARKTADKYLYKKAKVYNEHSIGSAYILREYYDKYIND